MFHIAGGIVLAVIILNGLSSYAIAVGDWLDECQAKRTIRRMEKARRKQREEWQREFNAARQRSQQPPPQPKPSPPKPERPRQPPDGATYSERVKFWEEEEPSFAHTAFGILYGGFLMTIFTLALADHIHLIDLNALIHPPSRQVVHTAPAATPPRLAVPSTAPPTPWGIAPVVR
jgi:hypothetical protein